MIQNDFNINKNIKRYVFDVFKFNRLHLGNDKFEHISLNAQKIVSKSSIVEISLSIFSNNFLLIFLNIRKFCDLIMVINLKIYVSIPI